MEFIDDFNPTIVYSGTWEGVTNPQFYNSNNRTRHFPKAGASASFSFSSKLLVISECQ